MNEAEEKKKENCAHADWEYKKQGFYVVDRWRCNIGDIRNCKECKKFYNHNWLKSDMESEETK